MKKIGYIEINGEDSNRLFYSEYDILSEEKSSRILLNFPKPRTVARVDLEGDFPSMTELNSVKMELFYSDYSGNKFNCFAVVKWQGHSSLSFPKKNLRVDLIDSNDNPIDIRFGNWIRTDSFDLKVNWTDMTQVKNIALCRIAHEIDMDYPAERRFPWWPKLIANENFLPADTPFDSVFDTGARSVIDGFPIEIHINNQYYGLGTWNLKKDRKNMQMKKNNNSHIWLDGAYPSRGNLDWSNLEIRNPSGFTANTEPPAGDVKTAIETFHSWLSNTADFKGEAADHLYVDQLIDYHILINFWMANDNVHNNLMFCTWDKQRWVLRLYDLDLTLGTAGFKPFWPLDTPVDPSNVLLMKIATNYQAEIRARYKYLRERGFLTVEYHEKMLRKISGKISYEDYERDLDRWPNLRTSEYGVSIPQMCDWLGKHIPYVDNYFNYNQ